MLNKFRGDPTLLPPAPEQLEQLTGVPTLGVLPWLEHGLPDEDQTVSSRSMGQGTTLRLTTCSEEAELS